MKNEMASIVVETPLSSLPPETVEVLKTEATRRGVPIDTLVAEGANKLAELLRAARMTTAQSKQRR